MSVTRNLADYPQQEKLWILEGESTIATLLKPA